MHIVNKWTIPWVTAAVFLTSMGCEEEKKETPKAQTAPPKAEPSAAPVASAPAPAPAPTETAPAVECPKGSTGQGTFDKPCEATGAERLMEVTWNGKIDDKGPVFKVINKSPSTILHGKVVVYYYDKAGKQIEIPPVGDAANNKPKPFHTCSGNIFSGVMKPAEKAFFNFSCTKKDRVPEGVKAIEAEIQMVGFADDTEKKVSYYWRNAELTPDARPKGGVKAKKK